MSDVKLRDYQIGSIKAITEAWAKGQKRPAVVLPTGMGKTVIFADLIRQELEKRPVVLVHRDELVKQTVRKIHSIDPKIKVGVIKGTREEVDADVVVASVQTLGRQNRLERIPCRRFKMIIVDEAHHAAADSYVRVLTHFGAFEKCDCAYPDGQQIAHSQGCAAQTVACGFTATMAREAGGLAKVWDEIVYTKDVLWGIVNGYLVNVKGRQVPVAGLDLNKIRKSKGDFQDGALSDALTESGAMTAAALAYLEHAKLPGGALRQGMIFAPTVASAYAFAAAFNEAGITTEVIEGSTPTEERDLIYKRAEAGEVTVLSSCMVLTEGFDMPQLSCAVVARPTTIKALYTQMIGRVLRPSLGKKDALVLDIVGVSSMHKLASIWSLVPDADPTIKIQDDETITDAIEREKAKIKWLESEDGGISGKMVDLFQQSTSAWLQTHKGTWFVPTKSGYFFLARDERPEVDAGTWLIGFTADQYRKAGAKSRRYALGSDDEITPDVWGWVRAGLDLGMAMGVAENLAEQLDGSVSSRASSWRQKSKKISESQQGLLERLGLPFSPDITRSDASDTLSIHYASRALDR